MTRNLSHLSSCIETKGDNYTRLERRNQELWMMKQTRKDFLRIKAEINDSVTCEDFDEDVYEFGETYDEIGSQPPRQQPFYQDLDTCLHGLPRDRYICEWQKMLSK